MIAGEKQVAAGNVGSSILEPELSGDVLEVGHLERALADQVHAAQQGDIRSHAASSRRVACARASSVTDAPDSIRAISSRRSSAESLRTVVRVPSPPWLFSIR